MFGHDPSGHVAPQLRDLGERLRRTYCSAARGAVEVVSAPREAGTPVQELPDIVFGVCVCLCTFVWRRKSREGGDEGKHRASDHWTFSFCVRF